MMLPTSGVNSSDEGHSTRVNSSISWRSINNFMYFRGTGGLPVFMPDGENLGARDLNTL